MPEYSNILTSLGNPKHVLAPMVDGSELAWRMFGRQYGVHLTYTPMIHSVMFLKDKKYRNSCLQFAKEDRPLIAQLCSNSPETFVKAAKAVEPYCDAIDLNLGCPQGIAKRGHYGAFLQDEWELISEIVKYASVQLSLPVTCKIRVFPDVNRTIQYAKMLEASGASLLTVHGRTREMKGHMTGLADWEQIRRVKEAVSIPIIANGNIQYWDDIQRCFEETKVDAVMSAEGHLHNPAIFAGLQPSVYDMSMEYLSFADRYPTSMSIARGHIFKILHHSLGKHVEFRQIIGLSQDIAEMRSSLKRLQSICKEVCSTTTDTDLPYPHWICQPYERHKSPDSFSFGEDTMIIQDDKSTGRGILLKERQLRRENKRSLKQVRCEQPSVTRSMCSHCNVNLRGSLCPIQACRGCCWKLDPERYQQCPAHHYEKKRRKDLLNPIIDVQNSK